MTTVIKAHGGIAISVERGWEIWTDAADRERGLPRDGFRSGWWNRRGIEDAILDLQKDVVEEKGLPEASPLTFA